MLASELQPGDVITGPIRDEKAGRPARTITNVVVRTALVRFRCYEGTKHEDRNTGGEIWELEADEYVQAYRPSNQQTDVDRAIAGAEAAIKARAQ